MARVPEIIRRGAVSQVATHVPKAGDGWAALANAAKAGADFVKPAAIDQARENGLNSVYRDENGNLKVDMKGPLSGELGDAHNTAARAKYLATRSIDLQTNMSELAAKYEFDPAGFKEASDLYIQSITAEEGVDGVLKDEIVLAAKREASNRFNGLNRQRTKRDQSEANRETKTQRDLLADDYVNLIIGGDIEAAEEVYRQLESVSDFRREAPYISETPAETEAYLRGVRGSGKAAQLTQRLESLIGKTELSDEDRAEIDTLLNDPDIAPEVRSRLQVATQGRLKSIDANGIVKGMTDGSYEGRIIQAESSGKDTARNPNSTALGPHQFLKGTWLALVKRHKPDWAKGLSEGELLGLRADRSKSSEMFAHFRDENQGALRAAGLPITHATEYMAHFFGAGGAVDVLSHSPDTLVSEVVKASVIKANPFLNGMTVRDVQNWAARKMTMKSTDIALQQTKIDLIEDTELRAMASKALSEQFAIRSRFENAAAGEYETRVAEDDPSLTEQEIMENHDLSDADQDAILSKLQKVRKDQIEMAQTVADLNNPAASFDIYKSEDRKRVNAVYENSLNGESPTSSAEHIGSARQITQRTGFAPLAMFNALRAGMRSDDPAVVAQSAEIANQLLQDNPTAFAAYGGRKELENSLSDYRQFAEFNGGEAAGQQVIDARQDVPKNLSKEAKDLAKEISPSDIIDHFDDWFFDNPSLGSGIEEAEMVANLQRLVEHQYIKTGDEGLARARAFDEFGRIYGPNLISGNKRIMKFPPQKFIPPVQGSHKWAIDQLESEVSAHVFGDKAGKTWMPVGGGMAEDTSNWVEASSIKLMSDTTTRSDINSGRTPSYVVYYMTRKGELQQLPMRYVFDPSEAQAAAEAQFEANRTQSAQNASRQRRRTPGPQR